MANGIDQAHKLGKQNMQQRGSTTDSSNAPSTKSNCNEKLMKTMISRLNNY